MAAAGCSRKWRAARLGMAYEDISGSQTSRSRPAVSRGYATRCSWRWADPEIAEFLHPRVQEIADTLPASIGRWLLGTDWARQLAERLLRKGRVVKTTSVSGFLLLYGLSKLKPLRRHSLRFAAEQAAFAEWLDRVAEIASSNYALAVEVAACAVW